MSAPAKPSGLTEGVIWLLRIVLGFAFLFFSVMKLSGSERMVADETG